MKPEEEFKAKERERLIPAVIQLINGENEIVLKGTQNARIYNIALLGVCLKAVYPDLQEGGGIK